MNNEGITIETSQPELAGYKKRATELVRSGRPQEARKYLEDALLVEGETVETLQNFGVLHRRLNETGAAMDYLRRAERMMLASNIKDPMGRALLYSNLSVTLFDLGDFDAAATAAVRSYTYFPNAVAMWSLATTRLTQGNLEYGWPIFARRTELPAYSAGADYGLGEWDGRSTCERLLLVGEQGIGERLMYASTFDEAAQTSGAHVHIELTDEVARLKPILERSFPAMRVMRTGEDMLAAGAKQILMGDVARILRPTFDRFPKARGYLKLDEGRRQALRAKIPGDGPIIGLSWHSKNPQFGAHKSIDLARLVRGLTAIPNARFVNVQYGDLGVASAIERAEREAGLTIHQPLTPFSLYADIDATAHLIGACDHVVTISNINAHLAGGLGVPTSLVMPRFGYGRVWYWFDRDDSPWYPATRIYRANVRDWDAVMGKLTAGIVGAINGRRDDGT